MLTLILTFVLVICPFLIEHNTSSKVASSKLLAAPSQERHAFMNLVNYLFLSIFVYNIISPKESIWP